MKKWSRLIAFFAVFLLAFNLLPAAAAEEVVYAQPMERPWLMASGDTDELPSGLREYLNSQFERCYGVINVEAYGLHYIDDSEALSNLIYYEMSEAFHVLDVQVSYNTGTYKIRSLLVDYACTATEYGRLMGACESVADEILRGIEGNAALTDVERALLVHDRLILHCEYDHAYATSDTRMREAFTLYGALAEGSAVCMGYTAAYDYLMERLGYESRFCTSEELNHCWNIVKINGKEYHIDTTWDDPTYGDWDLKGEVYHDHFLNSNTRCIELHEGVSDFEQIVTNTVYDDYFWVNSRAAFILLGNEIYYIDHESQTLRRYRDHSVLLNVADSWNDYELAFSYLDGFDGYLYYNSKNAIYEMDPATGETEQILTPALQAGELIYGFTVENGSAVYDVSADPEAETDAFTRRSEVILPYKDLADGAWYRAGIRYAYRNSLMNGMTATAFGPDTTMSRAMLVTVLYRLSGTPDVSTESPFADVSNQWFADAVIWASENGIVNGMTPTTFAPDAPVTRAQMVTILYRYAQMRGFDTSAENNLSGFADRNSVPAWAQDALEWAVAEGIVNGMSEGGRTYLRYDHSTTRAQVATVLMRYLRG